MPTQINLFKIVIKYETLRHHRYYKAENIVRVLSEVYLNPFSDLSSGTSITSDLTFAILPVQEAVLNSLEEFCRERQYSTLQRQVTTFSTVTKTLSLTKTNKSKTVDTNPSFSSTLGHYAVNSCVDYKETLDCPLSVICSCGGTTRKTSQMSFSQSVMEI